MPGQCCQLDLKPSVLIHPEELSEVKSGMQARRTVKFHRHSSPITAVHLDFGRVGRSAFLSSSFFFTAQVSDTLNTVQFRDESSEIASEYKGGFERYAVLNQTQNDSIDRAFDTSFDFGAAGVASESTMPQQPLPPIQAPFHEPNRNSMSDQPREIYSSHTSSTNDPTNFSNNTFPPPQSSYSNPDQTLTPPNETQDYLNSPEEVLFMQVFVEEVGLWMDSMDPMKHVRLGTSPQTYHLNY